MNKPNLHLIGFLQALGVALYCALVGGTFWLFDKFFISPPGFLGVVLILTFFVFSAAVTGSLVFGYSAYLVLNQKIKEALTIFAYTLLYCLAILAVIVIVLVAR